MTLSVELEDLALLENKKDIFMNKLILASRSPRRIELLRLITPNFEIIPSNFDENTLPKLSPETYTMQLAYHKSNTVFQNNPNKVVIGCDTVVVSDNYILGIPQNIDQAYEYISMLSGKKHQVITGVSILTNNKNITFYESTAVYFHTLSQDDINKYLLKNEWTDKAGGYGIQGYGGLLVKKINGDYFNVVGLPLSKLNQKLVDNSLLLY